MTFWYEMTTCMRLGGLWSIKLRDCNCEKEYRRNVRHYWLATPSAGNRFGRRCILQLQVAQATPPVIGYALPPPQTQGFAAATAEATGQSKATTNRAIARADALGDEALTKVANTSLDGGVELDALAKMDAPERAVLVKRAAAGEPSRTRLRGCKSKVSTMVLCVSHRVC